MRYPVGARATVTDANVAAREAATTTGLRYRVYRAWMPYAQRGPIPALLPWQFAPADKLDAYLHEPVRL